MWRGLVRSAGAPVDVFAVGTRVGVSQGAPSLDAAYKLTEYDRRPMMKLSEGKATLPGAKQIYRGPGCDDTVALRDEPAPPGTTPLLATVMQGGRRLGTPPPLDRLREELRASLDALPAEARRTTAPTAPRAVVSDLLNELTAVTRRRLRLRRWTEPAGAAPGPTRPEAGPRRLRDPG